MKVRFFLFMLAYLSLASCQQIMDNYWDRKEEENYVSSYMGTYKGNYSGDESGTLIIEVAKNGYTSVTKTSQYSTEEKVFSGMVREDGALQSVVLPSGFTLYGNLQTKSGTWKMSDWKGNWIVAKQ